MLGLLLRWAIRFFFFGLIAAAVGFVVTRVLGGEDEDFEDFEDLEESFEFTETPVEIDVSGPSTRDDSGADSAAGMIDTGSGDAGEVTFSDTTDVTFSDTSVSVSDTDTGSDDTGGNYATSRLEAPDTDTEPGEGDTRLIDIKGIGPGYELRLQSIGISTLEDLLATDPAQLADQLSVIGGATEVESWQEQARTMASDSTQA